MAEPEESSKPLSGVQKLKLQLFHRLQRRHRDAWKRYWGSFQLYLAAQLSLEEFHALAEELLGPDKHLHNKFVVALLSTAYQDVEVPSSPRSQPPSTPELQDHNRGEVKLETNGGPSPTGSNDPLLRIIKEEGARHVGGDSEQRSRVHLDSCEPEPHGRKRRHSSVAPADNNADEAEVDNKLMHVDRLRDEDHPDHHSAQLLMGLGSSSPNFESRVASDGRRD